MPDDVRVLLLHGTEPFLIGEEGRSTLQKWKAALVSDFGYDALEPSGLTSARLGEAILQLPFLDPYRVVAVLWVAGNKADGLAAALKDVPETSRVLITVNGKLSANNRLLKAVAALSGGRANEMAPLRGRRLEDWTANRAAGMGLGPAVAAQVVRVTSPDLGVIDSELQKLAAFQAGGGRVDQAALAGLLVGGKEGDFFKLTDQILPRPGAGAWPLVRQLIDGGMGATSIAYRLARHVSLVLEVKVRLDRGERLPDLQSSMREHPFVIEKAVGAGRGVTVSRLREQLGQILNYEWEVKSGQIDADFGLEALLARF
ncbi:MAG TPA: hypothetical protein VG015_03190 [Candidatus Dormibacteraeota bacterium]|jgi:DNA polymerase-3 subunit delta|nr:hypothetical protein [Candidatus Dormibacteraeota bacterium]